MWEYSTNIQNQFSSAFADFLVIEGMQLLLLQLVQWTIADRVQPTGYRHGYSGMAILGQLTQVQPPTYSTGYSPAIDGAQSVYSTRLQSVDFYPTDVLPHARRIFFQRRSSLLLCQRVIIGLIHLSLTRSHSFEYNRPNAYFSAHLFTERVAAHYAARLLAKLLRSRHSASNLPFSKPPPDSSGGK